MDVASALTIGDALEWSKQVLAWSPTPRLDGELLLGHVLDKPRVWVLTHAEDGVEREKETQFRRLVERRAQGEPIAYLRREVEWHGRIFEVGHKVLIPRAETELVLEEGIALAQRRQARVVADIGTGSGAIAVELARSLPSLTVYAVDTSAEAIEVAKRNAARHCVADAVHFLSGDLIEPLPASPDLIVANLPYLSEAMMRELEAPVRFEPPSALHAGPTGLELYVRMFEQLVARGWLVPQVLEIEPRQACAMQALASNVYPESTCKIVRDYAGFDRVVVIQP